jgi:hypothetical protein
MANCSTVFNLEDYLKRIKLCIENIMKRPQKNNLTDDILDTVKTKRRELIALKERQRRMKNGEIWQVVIGNYKDFSDLGIGHKTGLDILSIERKIIIELKNRTNTDNSSSRKANLDKLATFKKENPEYTCIYATINANKKDKTLEGFNKKIIHNSVEIEHKMGYEFLTFIFGENTEKIIQFIKDTLDENM